MPPAASAFLTAHVPDLLAVAGLACVVWGVASIYRPAGWIVLGLALLGAWWRL
jgi:hypothetical protein